MCSILHMIRKALRSSVPKIYREIINQKKVDNIKVKIEIESKYKLKLTVFAFALLDEGFIFDFLMARFAIKPGSVTEIFSKSCRIGFSAKNKPFNFISRLCNKKSLSIGNDFRPSRIDGNFCVHTFSAFDFNCQEEELQFCEA